MQSTLGAQRVDAVASQERCRAWPFVHAEVVSVTTRVIELPLLLARRPIQTSHHFFVTEPVEEHEAIAGHGWTVDAVDISFEALSILRDRAGALPINPVLADLDQFECRPAAYDLVVQTFFLKRGLLPRVRNWVRLGGLLYIETHLRGAGAPAGGRYALRPGELAHLFRRWDILTHDEGEHPEGTRRLATARLLARRPAP